MPLGPPPYHQRRPPALFEPFHHPTPKQTNKPQLLSMFKSSDGQFDLEKVARTVEQISQVYGQVSPIISKFTKK